MGSAASTLILRADASTAIGTGHVMRCMALAQAWKAAGGSAAFACAAVPEPLERRIRAAGFGMHAIAAQVGSATDAGQTVQFAASLSSASRPWVVADGYRFGPEFQRAIRTGGGRLLLIDDYGSLPGYEADILLNQNIDADRYRYPADSTSLRLLGPRYALLRPEFSHRPPRSPVPAVARRILVTMGGGDPDNTTTRIARALRRIDDPALEVRLLAGAAFPHLRGLEAAVAGDARFSIVPFADDMPRLMAWADLAVCAGGSTCWELLRIGVPLIVLVLADNQRGIAERLGAENLAINLGWYESVDEGRIHDAAAELLRDTARRISMSERGPALVDGLGARRVVGTMLESENI